MRAKVKEEREREKEEKKEKERKEEKKKSDGSRQVNQIHIYKYNSTSQVVSTSLFLEWEKFRSKRSSGVRENGWYVLFYVIVVNVTLSLANGCINEWKRKTERGKRELMRGKGKREKVFMGMDGDHKVRKGERNWKQVCKEWAGVLTSLPHFLPSKVTHIITWMVKKVRS